MDIGYRLPFIIFIYLMFANANYGCEIEGITNWWQDFSVLDTQRGVIFQGTTNNILGIVSAVHSGDSLNAGPYFTAHLEDSQFVLSLNDNYANYEENETSQSMSISVSFSCTGGGTRNIVFIISIVDTNNNAPVFTQSNEIIFRVTPPLPPGYQLTGCLNDISVRDIDLTTKKLEFTIQQNDFVDIEYNAESTSDPKNFKAKLRTKSFIRSLAEPIVLTISATDVDQTGDPPLTTYATIRIESDGQFELPEEPRFSQTFYTATYSKSDLLTIEDAIYLEQGYHSEIKFGIVGEYSDYFHLSEAYNSITIQSTSELPRDVLESETQLYLIVTAERNNTNGASATVIIQLPEDEPLTFEQTLYKGTINNNVINLTSLQLTGGYTLGYDVTLKSDYDSYFSIVANDNALIVSMAPLDDDVIENNNFLSLEVIATSSTSTVTAAVILEIIKEKITSLSFEQHVYRGNYKINEGLILNDLVVTRGYDDTVSFYVEGDYFELFFLSNASNILSLHLSDSIPDYVIEAENVIQITIFATKPGVDDVHTVVLIELPQDRRLKFEQSNYVAQLRDSNFAIENIRLYNYEEDVAFQLIGELATYFNVIDTNGTVNLQWVTALPEEIILENNLLVLTLEASALYSATTATTIVVEIIKRDFNTPVFSNSTYEAVYDISGAFRISGISLSQGYDDTVVVDLEGDDSKYFTITDNSANIYEIDLKTYIPRDVIMEKKVLTFNILAEKPLTVGAIATVTVRFPSDLTEPQVMTFTKTTYLANITQGILTTENILLLDEYDSETQFGITGEYSEYFDLYTAENNLNIVLNHGLPSNIDGSIIVLTLEASRPRSVDAKAGLIIQIEDNISVLPVVVPVFSEVYYKGHYSLETELIFEDSIYLKEGYSNDVFFYLDGENSQWFTLKQDENSLTLEVNNEIPEEILIGHRHLVFTIVAHKSDSAESRAAIFVELITDISASNNTLAFTNTYYYGTIGHTGLSIDPIEVHEEFDFNTEVVFSLSGDYSEYFYVTRDESHIYIILGSDLPLPEIVNKNLLIFSLEASTQTELAQATIVIEIIRQASVMAFEQEYYRGNYSYKEGLHFDYEIKLDEYDAGNDVQFSLSGENSQWFALEETEKGVTLALLNEIPAEILENNYSLIFYVSASDGSNWETARATIIIGVNINIRKIYSSLSTATTIKFNSNSYQGFLDGVEVSLSTNITLEEANDNISFSLTGDYSEHFLITHEGVNVMLTLSEPLSQEALSNINILIFEIEASAAGTLPGYTIVILEVKEGDVTLMELSFTENLYIGHYSDSNGLEFDQTITLSVGYEDGLIFTLNGDHAKWFTLIQNDNQAILTLSTPISTDILENNKLLVFTVATANHASKAEAFIVITLDSESRGSVAINPASAFDKALYNGIVNATMVQHEIITVDGDSGNVELSGTYAELFLADLSDGLLKIILKEPVPFADEIKYVVLEILYEGSSAVLLLNVSHTDNTMIPTVNFDLHSYHLTVDIASVGQIGQVRATATNGEALLYTLRTNNSHIQERIFINDGGEIYLSAFVNSGRYRLEVHATTIGSQIFAVAPITLTVKAVFSCEENRVEVPPLITISGDEEIPHENLLVLNTTRDCWYSIESSWPPDQDWLYVDENGLHTRAIDREDERIAFMALSQVQVELLLHCRDDNLIRDKRSTDVVRPDWLGPYDYESHNWILTENILFNSRRSFVNFIVNDINDNAPILEGKGDGPVVIGYPVPELLDYIEPDALIRLKASDADIGINAEIIYWTNSQQINVSPTSGTVHLPDNERNLSDRTQVTVYATDRLGDGLTGELDLLIRLLNDNHITVITIRNAYLEYEEAILNNIASLVGYDVKSIKSVILSDEYDVGGDPNNLARGSSLKLFVYGLINNEPILASQLIFDLNNSNTRQAKQTRQVAIAESLTLRDYLDKRQLEVILIAEGRRDIGLLITTIVLSILLFIIIVVIAVWLFLQWRTTRNYDKFSDPGSLDSEDSHDKSPRTTSDSLVVSPEDIKVSENRFQVIAVPEFGQTETNAYVVIDMPESNETNNIASNTKALDTRNSAAIQTIDKLKDPDDGGDNVNKGETSKRQRKKSVTFNEKVEKIILPEPEDMSKSITEIYSIKL